MAVIPLITLPAGANNYLDTLNNVIGQINTALASISGGSFVPPGSGGSQPLVAGDIASIAWTGTTAPSGTLTANYSWQQVGNMVTGIVALDYVTAGTALTALAMNLPAGMPAPKPMGAAAAANVVLAPVNVIWVKTNDTTPGAAALGYLNVNSGNTGYTLNATSASVALKGVYMNFVYETGI